MVDLSSFRNRIAPRVLTALDYTIDLAVLDTCIDFCERSLVVQATLDAFPTVAGTSEYDLDPPSHTKIARVMGAWADGSELVACSRDQGLRGLHAASISQGAPQGFLNDAPDTITILPAPDRAYSVTARVSTKPSRTATQVDDQLYEDWCDGIVDGALARLHGMPHQPFTDPKLQATHFALYQQAVNRAMLAAEKGRNRAEQRIRPVWI
jgi:hypothetical protein